MTTEPTITDTMHSHASENVYFVDVSPSESYENFEIGQDVDMESDNNNPPEASAEKSKPQNGVEKSETLNERVSIPIENSPTTDEVDLRRRRTDNVNSFAANKNVAEGLMDIALLSANANQLRFLLTYNYDASTFYISLGLVIVSLVLQIVIGIALIFKRRLKWCNRGKGLVRTQDILIMCVFIVTVVNVLLAAFTTTDAPNLRPIENKSTIPLKQT